MLKIEHIGSKHQCQTQRCRAKLVKTSSRMRTERSPNSLAFVHTLCTVRKENQRIFVHIKRPAIPTAFLGRKYDLQAADFQDDAVWGVIWLADK